MKEVWFNIRILSIHFMWFKDCRYPVIRYNPNVKDHPEWFKGRVEIFNFFGLAKCDIDTSS